MEAYCLENNIPFEVFLNVDKTLAHPLFIGNLSPNINMGCLPPNASSLIQSVGQGVIAALKYCYLRRTFALAFAIITEV
jgi:hypothetical protein